LSSLALTSSIRAEVSAFILAHRPRALSASSDASCLASEAAALRSAWAWSIRALSCSRDSLAAAAAALASATRCWSASSCAEKSMLAPVAALAAALPRVARERNERVNVGHWASSWLQLPGKLNLNRRRDAF
jgi:hypothetical protein